MTEFLLEQDEFINPDFSPSLKQIAWVNYRARIRQWKFHDMGVPAPTLTGNSAAYWLASVKTKFNELPLIAISTSNPETAVNAKSSNWYSGLIHSDYLDIFQDDPVGLHRTCLDSAMAGPAVLASALKYFAELETAEEVPLPVNVEQFAQKIK